MGAVKKVQLNTASRLPTSRPKMKSKALTPAGQEQRADHQLGARHVLAGELADVALQPEQGLLRHRLALVFVDGVVVLTIAHRGTQLRPTPDDK